MMSDTFKAALAESLRDPGDGAEYLNIALDTDEPAVIVTALRHLAAAANDLGDTDSRETAEAPSPPPSSADMKLAEFLRCIRGLGLRLEARSRR